MTDENIMRYGGKVLTGKEFREYFPNISKKLVLLENINENENENQMKISSEGEYISGGIYFITTEFIRWGLYDVREADWRNYCRMVEIPLDCKIYIKTHNIGRGEYYFMADRINVGEKMEISDLPLWLDIDKCVECCKSSYGGALRYIKNYSNELLLALIDYDPRQIEYLLEKKIKVCEEVQLAAVKKDGYLVKHLIKYIGDVSEEVKKAAVSRDGDSIRYLFQCGPFKYVPSEELQLMAVKNCGSAIECILGQLRDCSLNVKIAAVQQDGHAIKYLCKNTPPSEEIQKAAVEQDGGAIIHLLKFNISEEVKLAAVKRNGYSIKHLLQSNIYVSEKVRDAALNYFLR